MQTITQKKKLSKGTWALIFIAIAAVIAVAVLAAVGHIDLGFLTAPYDMETGTSGVLVGYATFGTISWINAALIILAPFAVGIVLAVLAYRYFVGQKVTVASSIYTPQTGATTPTNQGTSTELG